MNKIKNFYQFINESFTEFNLQRMNPDSARASIHVDDPKLSIDAFDKHQDAIRLAMSRVNDILYNLAGTDAYRNLKNKLLLDNQGLQNLNIIRIVKNENMNYDVYIRFSIEGKDYWGVIKSILSTSPEFKSEVFKDLSLLQKKEWVIKLKGLIIKAIKLWLKPESGIYKLVNNEVICYSTETGKQLKMERDIEIELVRAHDDKIIIKYEGDYYNLVGDNYIYFNWWFEKID